MDIVKVLEDGLASIGIEFNSEMINKFNLYLDIYMQWNSSINISAIRDKEEVIKKHFLDSVAPIVIIEKFVKNKTTIIDLGSGGGFPAIPLKIVKPMWNIDAADVNKKKLKFLSDVINTIGLSEIKLIDSSQTKITNDYDIVISRAFGEFDKNIIEAKKYLKKKGYIILYKATKEKIDEEIKNSKMMKNRQINIENITPIIVPFIEAERHLVILR